MSSINQSCPRCHFANKSNARARRVILLLVGILTLSTADFLLTVAYLQSTGMIEINPIAAYIIQVTNSPWALAGFKAVTVGICASVLFVLRRRVEGEAAAWVAIAILAAMSLHWHLYTEHYSDQNQIRLATVEESADWLMFD